MKRYWNKFLNWLLPNRRERLLAEITKRDQELALFDEWAKEQGEMKTEYIQELLFATSRRQTGKSHLLQEGIKDYDRPFMLVCRNIREGKRLTNNNQNATYITPETINNLKGSNSPIIFDQQEVLEYLQQILYHKNKLPQCKSSCKEFPSKEIKDYKLSDMVSGYKTICKPDANFEKYYSKGFTECWEWLRRITK